MSTKAVEVPRTKSKSTLVGTWVFRNVNAQQNVLVNWPLQLQCITYQADSIEMTIV